MGIQQPGTIDPSVYGNLFAGNQSPPEYQDTPPEPLSGDDLQRAILAALVALKPVGSRADRRGTPQAVQIIEPSGVGVQTSQPIARLAKNLLLEVYAYGSNPAATVTVQDAPKGSPMQTALDSNAVRKVTGSARYVVEGVNDEIQVQLNVAAGAFAVRAAWVDGSPNRVNDLDLLDWSTTVLTGGSTYTGAQFTALGNGRIVGTAYADVAGTLYVDQSSDGTNYDYTSTYVVAAGVGTAFSTEVIAPFGRLRYINGVAGQATFRLYGFGRLQS